MFKNKVQLLFLIAIAVLATNRTQWELFFPFQILSSADPGIKQVQDLMFNSVVIR